jgi:heme/copper-type cytochrome/quinol oxidase subunit 3
VRLVDVAANQKGGGVSSVVQIAPPRARLKQLPFNQTLGTEAMWYVIITESMLFVCMFGAYYYLGNNKDRWAEEVPPVLWFPLVLAAILITSSVILYFGEKQWEKHNYSAARWLLWLTVVFGLGFLALQGYEYYSDWSNLAPYSDSYGSIFYTITSLHAAHVCAGLLLLSFVGILPRYGDTPRTPHRPYKAVAMYWHFVDVVWVFIVTFLYCIPHLQRYLHVH